MALDAVWRRACVYTLALSMTLAGCATTRGEQDSGSTMAGALGGVLGGVAGAAAAKALAAYDAKRLRLSPAEAKQRERGYMITFALMGAAAGATLSSTVYGKLKEQGRREREAALVAAAQQARPQRYGEPSDPALKGVATPGRRYADNTANRECVDVEDALSDAAARDAVFVKMCRSLPNGGWQQVTA